MKDSELLSRITTRPDILGGKPIVRDMRISVKLILSLLSQGVAPRIFWTTTRISSPTKYARAPPMHTQSLPMTPFPPYRSQSLKVSRRPMCRTPTRDLDAHARA